jgi:hypothetical protein
VSLLYIAMRLVHVADAIVTETVVQRTTGVYKCSGVRPHEVVYRMRIHIGAGN